MRRAARRWIKLLLGVMLLGLCGAAADFVWTYHGTQAPLEIYRGITYVCQRVPETPESGGLVHWVRADLNVPGVSLYITPLDPDALAQGWQFKLQYTTDAVQQQHLAAAVNGTLYASDSHWFRLTG